MKTLITLVDPKTGEKTEQNPRFIKQDQVAIAIFELSWSERDICMELFECYRELGRFTLLSEGRTVAAGNVLKIIQ